MSNVKEIRIELMREPPWWLHTAGYGVLVAMIYLLYTTAAAHTGVLVLGGLAIILWYTSNRFYSYAMNLFNERSLLNLLNKIDGTFSEDGGLIDTPKEENNE